jgi:serine/threonine protein phosphatase PrpC
MLLTEEGKKSILSYKDKSESPYDIYEGSYDDPDAKNRAHVTDVGCTACSCILTKDRIVCGNLGDSRAVLAKMVDGKLTAINLSEDHKPENDEEKKRIEDAGGSVDFARVDGTLALSRAIGDY